MSTLRDHFATLPVDVKGREKKKNSEADYALGTAKKWKGIPLF
jgi:hypothetical protein